MGWCKPVCQRSKDDGWLCLPAHFVRCGGTGRGSHLQCETVATANLCMQYKRGVLRMPCLSWPIAMPAIRSAGNNKVPKAGSRQLNLLEVPGDNCLKRVYRGV